MLDQRTARASLAPAGIQAVFRFWIIPQRKVGIHIRIHMPVDIVLCREVLRAAPNIRLSFPLVHTHVVNEHFTREDHRARINRLPIRCKGHQTMDWENGSSGGMEWHRKRWRLTIGSTEISRCDTPVPAGNGSGPSAAAPTRADSTPAVCHVIYPSEGFEGSDQYSKPAKRQTTTKWRS